MAIVGTELVTIYPNTGTAGPSAYTTTTTTQNIANLGTGGPPSPPLTGNEVVFVVGHSTNGLAAPPPFATTTGAIASLGSIATSTLTGLEIMEIGPAPAGYGASAVPQYVSTLKVAG